MRLLNPKTSRPFFSFTYRKFIRRRSLFPRILSIYLLPFTLFYLLAVYLKRIFTRKVKLRVPVISVGNITAGGTGKTPLVKYIAMFYQKKGKVPVISTSGSKRKRGKLLKAHLWDEILMLKANIPGIKITGKKKEEIVSSLSGDMNEVVIIDDGFHCHYLWKNLDILVIDMERPFDNNLLLPAGLLREPCREIKRADVFILSHPYMVNTCKSQILIEYLKTFNKPVFIMDYKIEGLRDKENVFSLDIIKDRNIIAFTGTGNPYSFFSLLSREIKGKIYGVVYPDHFEYRVEDIKELEDICRNRNIDILITTEKDYVKIKNYKVSVPLYYLKIYPVLKGINGKDFDTFLLNVIK